MLDNSETLKRISRLSKEQLALLEKRRRGAQAPEKHVSRIVSRAYNEPLPLSFAQQRLWFLDQLEPANPFYNSSKVLRLKGALDVPALERTLSEVVRRHEVLRTRFVSVGGEPRQEVLTAAVVPLAITDLSEFDEAEREVAVREAVTADSWQPFDLAHGPLLRAKLLRLSEHEHVVMVTMHHIVSDGWSHGVLVKEVATLYAAYSHGDESPLADLPIQYRDFAVWQRGWLQGAELERQLAYWRKQLGGRLPVLELPTDRKLSGVPTYRGARHYFRLSREVNTGLKELCRREDVTLFMMLLAAFQTLLYRYSGQDEIVVGTDVANRNYAETEALIGFFVNQLVLRTDLSGDPTFVELLQRVKEVCLGAYAHQDVPFEKLVEELQPERDLSRSPLFQVKLVLQNTPRESLQLDGLQLGGVGLDVATARFDLTVLLDDSGDELGGVVVYSTDLFDAALIERMFRHFEVLLQGIVAQPEQRLWELPLLREAEWQEIIEWNETRREYGPATAAYELFEAHAARQPEAVALVCGGEQLSYGELNRRANQLAHYLRKQGVGAEVVVGLCLRRSPEMLVALLGIMKAGGAYLPLDPEYPQQRLEYMLADAQVGLVLTEKHLLAQLPVHWGRTIVLDQEWEAIAQESVVNLEPVSEAGNLAYVIYTSGSTGQPKGVMVTHGGLRNMASAQIECFGVKGNARVLQFASLNFDASISEICMTLCQGAQLHLAPSEQVLVGATLSELLAQQEISVVTLPPSVLKQLRDGEEFAKLEMLIVAGEACGEELVEQWSEKRHLFNAYGPTEGTVCATVAECHRGEGRPAIGRAISNVEVYVLDEWQQPVAIGVRGEIYIGGAGVARGYWERAELTAERFVPHLYSERGGERLYRTGDEGRYLEDGRIDYLGRRDQQVKLRGYRIELGEIEAVLESHGSVQQAVVTVREESADDQRLVGYVVPAEGTEREVAAELRGYLKERLPEYMVPQQWVLLEQLPLIANGKVDRRALPAPSEKSPLEHEDSEWTPVEELVAGIWSEVLKVAAVGREENFFDLGGHSLLATQVISRVREVFGVEVELRRLFAEPALKGFSRTIEEELRAGAGMTVSPLVKAEREQWNGLLPLSFAQQRLWFLDQLEPGNTAYNVPVAVRLRGELDVAALERVLSEIARRHEVLRTRFVLVDGEPRQEVLEAAGVKLPITDLSGLDEPEREAATKEAVTAENREPFDLAHGPLLRAKLLRLGHEEHVVLLTMHHIVSDGWSQGLLIREVAKLYEAYIKDEDTPLKDLPVQYADFAVWQREWLRGEELNRQMTYWQRQLGGDLPWLELPTDYVRPAEQSYRGARLGFRLSPEVSIGFKELSRREGMTLFMTLLAAFQTLLHRYSGQDDIVVGSPVAGRNYAETEPLLGFFVNTLALRTDLSGTPTFLELLKRVKEVCLGAYAHQDVPFEKLVEELQPERDLSRSPLFQAMIILQNVPREQLRLTGLQLNQLGGENVTAKFDLTLSLQERGKELQGSVEYSTELFERKRIEQLLRHFEVLLHGIVRNPEQRLWKLPLLADDEWEQTIRGWNETSCDYGPAVLIQQLFEDQVERNADAVAVICGSEQLSYGELNRRANQLAHRLRRHGVGPEVVVGLCLERSPEMVVGLLGILKSGGAYLPLDPKYPRQRLEYMLAETQVKLVLTQARLQEELPLPREHTLALDQDWESIATESGENLDPLSVPGNLGYVIYTSGSTGEPKGVLLTQGSAVGLVQWARSNFTMAELKLVAASTSICFDLSVFELFVPLSSGGAVVLLESALSLLTLEPALPITLLNTVPSVIAELLRAGYHLPESVVTVNLAGEALSTQLVEAVYGAGAVQQVNDLYGPTEDTTYSTWERRNAMGRATIGRPISNTQVYILDQWRQPVAAGVRGEIYIGGGGLARGYLNDAARTAERFVPDPYSASGGERLYRTGDEGRCLEDGRIEFLGRRDQQVKLRGYRIELGEIEAVLESHAQVQQAVVTVREDSAGDQRLVGYVVRAGALSNEHEAAAELRSYLRERLPEYMVPQRWAVLDQMPLTANGKVDRQALPAPSSAGRLDQEDESEWTPVEELVAGIWSEVLKVAAIGRNENFFELGGHSLLATQVISRVREGFGIEVELRRLFKEPTVRGFAQSIEADLRAGAGVTIPALQPLGIEERERWGGLLPLSFAQQRLWFLDQLEPESASYKIPAAVRLKGRLDVAALERALSEIVRRHEMLRTRFVNAGGEPRQQVFAFAPVKLVTTDMSGLEEAEREAAVKQAATAEHREPFDLAHGPLLRLKLLRLSDDEHVVLMTMHHIVSDGWSMAVLIKEVAALYAAYSNDEEPFLPELPVQYGDFAVWQRSWLQGDELERQMSYWRLQFSGELPVLELPTDYARPAVQSDRGARQGFRLSSETTAQLRELSRREGVTLFMTMLAAFQTLLYRYSGQEDIAVGTDIANRNYTETESLIGFFVNQLVLRTDLGGEPTFIELLQRVKEVCLGSYAHQDVPFEKLVEELQPERHLSRSPLFQVKLVFQNAPRQQLRLTGLQLSRTGGEHSTANFDLTLVVEDQGAELRGSLEYKTELFEAARIERMLRHFEVLLQGIVSNADQHLWELPLLSEAEWREAVRDWNETRSDYGPVAPVQQLFEAQVVQRSDAVALVCGGEQTSYRELNARANQLAHYLRKQGVGPEVVVGLCLERSVEMVVALLGIMKAGGAYLPLDPEYPQQRLEYMLADAQVGLVLTEQRLLDQLPVHWGRTIVLDEEWEAIAIERDTNPEIQVEAANLVYVIYTSGSTGQPKGAMLTHAGLCNLAGTQVECFGVSANSRVLQFASLNFDASIFEICLALCHGGQLYLANNVQELVGPALRQLLQEQEISATLLPPSVLKQMEDGAELSKLEILIVGGEACGAEVVEQWSEGRRLYNAYGPTEATVYATVERCHKGAGAPPLGRAVGNVEVYVLDERLGVVPVGVRGEIYIGGAGLARGYWERAELTAERFVPHPYSVNGGERLYRTGDEGRYLEDGRIEYLGRRDQQVKVRGYRIELGEIEAALESHARVQQAVVTVREESAGDQRLVSYIVAEGSEDIVSELRSYLGERLPSYMVPQQWVVLEQLPLTVNGKVDREALPAPARAGELDHEADGEWTPVEELVAGIWSEVLKLPVVRADENFFELGGHSLLATQVISRVREVFGVEVGLRRLFEAPTVRGLSRAIELQLRAGAGLTVPPLERAERERWNGLLPLSFAQQRLWFLDQLEPGTAYYNSFKGLRLQGELDVAALERTLSEIVRRHEVLRTRFVSVGGEPRQEVLAAAAVQLAVTDLSGVAESEREAAVRAAATAASKEPFDLAQGPLLRVQLLRVSEQEQVVLLTMHHIVSDAWSMGVLIREVATLYEAYSKGEESTLAELPVQYGDFAVWQRSWLQGEELERQMGYWRRQLGGGALPVLELPTDRPRPPVQYYRGAQLSFQLNSELSAGLKELSRREGVTLFMTLLATFQTLLYRYSGQEEIVVGSDVANRNRGETEALIGFFVNQLVLRTDLRGEPTFVELLRRVKEVCLGAYAHQDVPFEKLVEELQPDRDLSRSPLFQVKLVLQNAPRESLQLGGLQAGGLGAGEATARFDLTLFLEERGEGLGGAVVYSTELFERARIERLLAHFGVLLQGIAAQPEQRLWELPLLREAEWQETVRDWNQTSRDDEPAVLIQQLFEGQAAQRPEAIALVSGAEQLSYGELNARANRLAHYLRKQGVGPEVVVGLCLERSVKMVVALLGIMKAGGAYLPLDPEYPQPRLEYLLADAQVGLVLTEQQLLPRLPVHWGRTLVLDKEWSVITQESAANPEPVSEAENLAYVIYTSGSTGQPKGVMVTHGGLGNYLQWASTVYPFAAGIGSPLHSTLSFDLTVTTLYAPLVVGGWIDLLSEGSGLEEAWQERSGYGVVKLTPAHLRLLNEGEVSAERLREWSAGVVVGGEALLWEQVRAWVAAGVRVYNEYGPTETVVGSSVYELAAAEAESGGSVSIGRPIGNTELYVLDQWQQPVAVGVRGEIYIGGAGVARGYRERAELTAERFVPHPYSVNGGERVYRTGDEGRYLEDGRIEYLGRRDQQVKVRGYRIELGEIEAVLESHGGVRQAIVTVREEGAGDQRLVGYVVGQGLGTERELTAELRSYLNERLPEYMVPQQWVLLEQLPLTANGKVDREALPAPSSVRRLDQEDEGEWTPVEELVAGIWSEVLKVAAVGREENFFDLGGHSLLATQVISRVREVFGVEVELRRLFAEPTVSRLSRTVEEQLRAGEGATVPPLVRAEREQWNGLLPLSFAQQRLWFLDQLAPGDTSYNIPVTVRLKAQLDVAVLERVLSEIVRRHEVLRTRFVNVGSEPRQQVLQAAEVKLVVTDLSELEETGRNAAVRQAVIAESKEPFDLAHGPLLRVKLLRFGAEGDVVLLTVHHVVSDDWSMDILVREVKLLYEAYSKGEESPLPDLPIQYGDFAVWQRIWLQDQGLERQLTYWRRQLAGELPVLELKTDRPRQAVPSNRGARLEFQLTPETSDRLRELSRREGATLFMTMLAAFQTLLHRYTGQQEIVVGTDVANRNSTETEALIGFFVNQLVLRSDLSGEPTFLELLRRVKEICLGAYAHQHVPFEKLVEELQPDRDLSRSPLFQVIFLLDNATGTPSRSYFANNGSPVDTTVRFDLTLSMTNFQNVLSGTWFYRTSLFDTATIERFRDNFATLLQSISADPNGRLSTLEILTPEEKERSQMKKWERDQLKISKLQALKRTV